MNALVLEEGRLKFTRIPDPVVPPDEALIRVVLAGICNTDLELGRGYMDFSGVPGHEFVGRVERAPASGWLGRRVVGEINVSCGACEFCRRGLGGHCPDRSVLGILRRNGAFAEYLSLPLGNLHVLPEEVTDREAVFVEPLAAALEIFEQVEVDPEAHVLVLGDGKLGLLAAQVMALRTRWVTAVGRHRKNLGILSRRGIAVSSETSRLPRKSYDIVVEATGNREGIQRAVDLVRPRGTLVLKSTFHGETCLDLSRLVVDEISLIGSRCGPFDKAVAALKSKEIDTAGLIEDVYPLEEGRKAFARAEEPGVLKVLLAP